MNNKGFTLIELVIMIILIGILSAALIVSLTPSKSVTLDAATKKLYSDIEYTRNMALSNAKWYKIDFVRTGGSYTYTVSVYKSGTTSVLADPSKPGSNFVIDLASQFKGVSIANVNGGTSNLTVAFNPLSVPYNAILGTTPNTSDIVINISNSSGSKTVTVRQKTGEIQVQ